MMPLPPIVFIFTLFAAFPIFGSQHDTQEPTNVIIIQANVARLNRDALRFCGQEYVNACKNFNIGTQLGEPCFPIDNYTTEDARTNLTERVRLLQGLINCTPETDEISKLLVQKYEKQKDDIKTPEKQHLSAVLDELQHIHYLPLKLLLNEDGNTFKAFQATLFLFAREIESQSYIFEVKINVELSSETLNPLREQLNNNPICSRGVYNKTLITYDLGENEEQELIAAGVLTKVDEKTVMLSSAFNKNKNTKPTSSWRSYAGPIILLCAFLAGSALAIQYLRSGKTAY